MNEFQMGLIEGFYGKPWSWSTRQKMANFLSDQGYGFYLYAPKCDKRLREDWQKSWDDSEFRELQALRKHCRDKNLLFGVGLSPFELYLKWNQEGKKALKAKLDEINELQPDILWVLFDDMVGDDANMAKAQADIVHEAASLSKAKYIAMCPTYYSYDPVLKALFGNMPEGYLENLGTYLDGLVDAIWTGPLVCSKSIPVEHLQEVTNRLKRRPLIWDNYPVNDGLRMTPFLYLRGFTGRTWEMSHWTASHAVNPMVQPFLSQIPMATLPLMYAQKEDYSAEDAWQQAARSLLSEDLYEQLRKDRDPFQDRGIGPGPNPNMSQQWIERIEKAPSFPLLTPVEKEILYAEKNDFEQRIASALSAQEVTQLKDVYQGMPSEYSEEIVQWLAGEFAFDPKLLEHMG